MKYAADERDSEESEGFFDIRGMAVAVLRWWWIIALATIIGGTAAFFYVRGKPIMYMSTEIIEIEDQKNTQLSSNSGDEDLKNPEVIETIIRSFRHRALMERVCDSLNLMSNPRFLGSESSGPADRTQVVETLLNLSSAKLQRGSRLVDVTFVHHDPIVAQNVVKALVEQFREQEMNQRLKDVERQNEMWSRKKRLLEDKLKESERKKQQYKEEAGSVSVEDEHSVADEKLRNLNTEWSVVRSELLQMEANQELIRKAANDPVALMTIPIIAQDAEVVQAKERLMTLETQLAAMSQRYREKYPAIVEAKAQLANARETFTRTIIGTPSRLAIKAKTAETRSKSLETAVANQEMALLELDKRTIRFRELQREYESDQTLFHSVLQREKESYAAVNTNFVRFNVVEPAVPATPLRNRRMIVILGSALGAGALVVVIVIGLFLLTTSIRTVDEAERVLGLPVLATVPILPKENKSALPGLRRTSHAVAESYRTLRTALSLPGVNQASPRIIFMTSAVSGEGKSFSAAQTAIAFAHQGLRSLVIDCDLRCPTMHTLFFENAKSPPGVAEYLLRKPSSVYPTKTENLWVLPAGGLPDNPAELLASPRFAKMIAAMKEGFDRVVVDTAPLNVVSDTLSTISFAESICLVVRCDSTPRKVVFRAMELLHRAGVKPSGVILNGVPQSKVFSNYYHYSADYSSKDRYETSGTRAASPPPPPRRRSKRKFPANTPAGRYDQEIP